MPFPQNLFSKNNKENLINEEIIDNNILLNNNSQISIIDELDSFLNKTFKAIDPKIEEEFKISLQSLRENIVNSKVRISFIDNINVGKSTVLNFIIIKKYK